MGKIRSGDARFCLAPRFYRTGPWQEADAFCIGRIEGTVDVNEQNTSLISIPGSDSRRTTELKKIRRGLLAQRRSTGDERRQFINLVGFQAKRT